MSNSSATDYVDEGLALFYKGEIGRAAVLFERAFDLDPANPRAVCSWGMVHHDRRDFAAAIRAYDDAIALDARYSRAYFNRGIARLELGEDERGFADFETAIELDPEPRYFLHRARIFAERGRFHEAIADATTYLRIESEHVEWAYLYRGLGYLYSDELDKARADLEEAIGRRAELAYAHAALGEVHLRLGDHEAAVHCFGRAIEWEPDNPDFLHQRAIALHECGRFDEVIRDYDRVVELSAESEITCYNRGLAWQKLGNPERAIADFTEAIHRKPDYYDALHVRAKAWRKAGEIEKAIADFSRCIEISPESTDAYLGRAHTWRKAGDDVRAAEDMATALWHDVKRELERDTKWRVTCSTPPGEIGGDEHSTEIGR